MRTLICLFLALCISLSFAGDCNNPLLDTTYNEQAPTTKKSTPEKVEGLSFCKNLDGKETCCNKDDINGMKDKFQKFKESFKEKDKKDTEFKEQQIKTEEEKPVDDTLKQSMQKLKLVREAARPIMKIILDSGVIDKKSGKITANLAQSTWDTLSPKLPTNYQSADMMKKLSLAVAKKYNITRKIIGRNFTDSDVQQTQEATAQKTFDETMQEMEGPESFSTKEQLQEQLKLLGEAKAKCFKQILKHQASMLCITCDADYASKKISVDATTNKPKIELKTSVCETLQKDCFSFINRTVAADKFKQDRLRKKVDIDLVKLVPSDVADLNAVAKFIIDEMDVWKQIGAGTKLRKMPPKCVSETNCPHACEKFLRPKGPDVEKVMNSTNEEEDIGTIAGQTTTRLLATEIDQGSEDITAYTSDGFDSLTYADQTGADTTYDSSTFGFRFNSLTFVFGILIILQMFLHF